MQIETTNNKESVTEKLKKLKINSELIPPLPQESIINLIVPKPQSALSVISNFIKDEEESENIYKI